jgi:hypothetical protein
VVLGYYDFTPDRWLGVSANWYRMQSGVTSLMVVGGITGNTYHVAIGEGRHIANAIGTCDKFVTPNSAPPQ